MRLLGEEITGGGTRKHHLALFAVKIGSESSQIEFGEKGTLQDGVDAMHSAELGFLNLVIQHASIAGSVHNQRLLREKGETKTLN